MAVGGSRERPIVTRVRRALEAVADPSRAPAMQAYMKSTMPFYGVPAPKLRAVARAIFAELPFDDAEAWRDDVLALFRGAKRREERYVAIALTGHRGARSFQTLDALPMYEEMIVTGAWWDLVDELASHRIGALLAAYPQEMKRTMRAWSRSDDLWKRRTSILCQLRFGAKTDWKLLDDCIRPSIDAKEFFLRKAIGWALRQLAWIEPEKVVAFVHANEAALSGLSKREALKNVARGKARRSRTPADGAVVAPSRGRRGKEPRT